jgi:gluconate 2-dehydrogenase gamma chain
MWFHRRELLATTAYFLAGTFVSRFSRAGEISGQLPWAPNTLNPPTPARPGPWQFFTYDEANAVEALADRIIPSDPQTAGGKDAGCAVYLDRQLAGPYGTAEGHYNKPPFVKGSKSQGTQSEGGPAKTYRDGLAALDRYCRAQPGGARFAQLTDQAKDDLLKGLEEGKVELDGVDGKEFFTQLVKDIQAGFFADPIYGGNRDMVAWRMIGFPGARYNYLDWIDRHNERYPLPPVSLMGRAEWTPKGG